MVFSISAKQATAIIALLCATVSCHVIMIEPTPFEFPVDATKQAPLSEIGSDFPCKFPAGFTPKVAEITTLKPGPDANDLQLKGGATHSGGSCQISLTTDTVPTKNSKWEVIKSIEGGCPSDAEGNLSDSAETLAPLIKFGVPDGMPAGKYTLAWTWFNKSGNREMYMNCAPVQIGGGAAIKREVAKISKKRQTGLPSLFMANIGNGCTTSENSDVTFPDPGENLVRGGKVKPGPPAGSCGAAGAQPAGSPANSTAGAGAGAGAPAAGGAAGSSSP
jgi:hypothetical protein